LRVDAVTPQAKSAKWEQGANMQGDKIGEGSGKVTARRVLPNSGGGPRMETSFESVGRLLGVDCAETGTYTSTVRTNGTMFGEGQGVLMGKGGELATWVGQGVGTMRKDGGVSYRGAVYYETSSPAWSRLNAVAAIFEYELDVEGRSRSQLWEWK
jgi:hypothetical protein